MVHSLPIVVSAGPSGSGKTTPLKRVLAPRGDEDLRLAAVTHAGPGFDIDPPPGKGSFRVRRAGADQVLVASRELHRSPLGRLSQCWPLDSPSPTVEARHG
jgi:molybdopterin molybdotransferase